MSNDKDKLTIKDVAYELGVNEKTVRAWIKKGELRSAERELKWGGYLILRKDLDDFIARRTRPEETE